MYVLVNERDTFHIKIILFGGEHEKLALNSKGHIYHP